MEVNQTIKQIDSDERNVQLVPLKYLQRSVRVNTNTLSQSSQHSWDKYRFIRRKITRFITIFVISHLFDDYEKNCSKNSLKHTSKIL